MAGRRRPLFADFLFVSPADVHRRIRAPFSARHGVVLAKTFPAISFQSIAGVSANKLAGSGDHWIRGRGTSLHSSRRSAWRLVRLRKLEQPCAISLSRRPRLADTPSKYIPSGLTAARTFDEC